MLKRGYLEIQARLDFVCQDFCDRLVEGGDDFHGSLRLEPTGVDQVIEGVDEGNSDTVQQRLQSALLPALTP